MSKIKYDKAVIDQSPISPLANAIFSGCLSVGFESITLIVLLCYRKHFKSLPIPANQVLVA